MHLGAKKLAFLGLLMAITVVLIILSGILDFNTLFLLAGASYCVGIAFREYGIRIASGFCAGCIVLGFLLSPNKLYCITFTAMSVYLLASEFAYDKLQRVKNPKSLRRSLWLIKYLIFNLMYIPALLVLPMLFYSGDISEKLLFGMLIIGQAALFIFDRAYVYFQGYIWSRLRRNLKL